MTGRIIVARCLTAVTLTVAGWIGAATVEFAFTPSAQAQFFGDQQSQYRRSAPRSSGFFQNFFGPSNQPSSEGPYEPQQREQQYRRTQQPSDSSRAPAPRKSETKTGRVAAETSIVVMGDGMADWLAYGLEEAFADAPEVGITRKNKLYSGLLHYDAKGDLDWWHVARDILAQEKTNYVVMMLGLSDRDDIRQKDLAKEAEKKAKDQQAKNEAVKKNEQTPAAQADNIDRGIAPEADLGKKAHGAVEFRTDAWAKIYSRRIDETIAALKSKGVPVFWVGLPSIRGARSTSEAAYLNDLYRARAERAGAIYIDVWDGFVDEAGKYSNYGPDYEGQTRRLRSSDGVFFTKYGARKLAHYVERELRRYMSSRVPVALPSGSALPPPPKEEPAARPLAGPVVPLTARLENSDDLLGGRAGPPSHSDPIAIKVFVKGESIIAPPGRADDFVWPRGSNSNIAQPAAPPASSQTQAVSPAAASALASVPAIKPRPIRRTHAQRP